MNAWRIHRGPDRRSPIEIRTTEPVMPGAVRGALIARLTDTLENRRHARLIEAAPELLVQLKAARDWMRARVGSSIDVDPTPGWRRLNELIERAEGRI